MLYKKNNTTKLDIELYKNHTSEYRGTPFWAWNCKLEKEELERQIEILKEMGFGGFHMHSRSGMATEYLSEEFMNLVKACPAFLPYLMQNLKTYLLQVKRQNT